MSTKTADAEVCREHKVGRGVLTPAQPEPNWKVGRGVLTAPLVVATSKCSQLCSGIPSRYTETQQRPLLFVVLFAAIIGGAALLYFFNPTQFAFYPTCIFFKTTGLLCPGCGTLRAIHQLLHGHIEAAFRFNALIVASLPFAAWSGWQCLRSRAANRPALAWITPRLLWIGFAILLLFGILRNLPGAARYFLAPLA